MKQEMRLESQWQEGREPSMSGALDIPLLAVFYEYRSLPRV